MDPAAERTAPDGPAPAGTGPARIIRKYPNRRLYDTEISRYITLDEVRQLVLDNVPLRVEDKPTGRDITRSILLQVIAEQEEDGEPIFTTELLRFLVKFYGDPMQGSVSRYLELSTQLFMEQHSSFNAQLRKLVGQTPYPLALLKDISDKQRPIWRLIRREFLKSLGRSKRRRGDAGEPDPTGSHDA